MTQRYFSETRIEGEAATLTGPEAHHLLHVMRAGMGEQVVVFDGSGTEFQAEIAGTTRHEVALRVLSREEVDRESEVVVTLGVALPKGDRQKVLVEKATELGVARLVPLITARSVAEPNAKALERLRRVVIEASKQCGRNRLMEVASPLKWIEWLDSANSTGLCLLAHPSGKSLRDIRIPSEKATDVTLAIGPEGGFTDEEAAQAVDAGWTPVSLGPRILRIETAAVALAACFLVP